MLYKVVLLFFGHLPFAIFTFTHLSYSFCSGGLYCQNGTGLSKFTGRTGFFVAYEKSNRKKGLTPPLSIF